MSPRLTRVATRRLSWKGACLSRPALVKKLVASGCAVLFSLGICEVALRYILDAWPFETGLFLPGYLTSDDAPLRWRFSEGNGRNRLGLKSREITPKEPGTYRILFLGDSLIWTGETSSTELYTEVVERRLNSREPKPWRRIEVINAGVPGYTTYQELEFLKIYGIGMEPDLVVLGFVFNDLHYEYLHKPTDRGLLDREPTTHLQHFDPRTAPGSLVARSYLAHEALRWSQAGWKTMLGRPVFPFELRNDFYLAWKEHAWDRTRQLIREMRHVLATRGAGLRLLVFPVTDQVNVRYRRLDEYFVLYPQRMIRQICAREGIELLDLTGPIYAHGGVDLFQDYLHLAPKGNDIVADEVERYLATELGL